MARKVTAADGTEWKVGREWSPWRLRLRREDEGIGLPEVPDIGGGDELAAIFVVIAAAILLVVAIVLGWFLIALAIELLVLLVGLIAGFLGRTLLRRPWVIRARAKDGRRTEHVWRERGWRASGERIDAVAGALERGLPLPDAT